MKHLKNISFLTVLLVAGAVQAHDQTEVRDPLYKFNRVMFHLNNVLDRAIFEPAAWTYFHVVPVQVRTPIGNALYNLREPLYFFNNLAQKNRRGANNSFKRFFINSTLGFAGLFDVASKLGFEKSKATLDESLARWGVKTGPYLFLPVIGPTNPRNLLSMSFENAASPMGIAGLASGEHAITYTWRGVEGLHDRAEALEPIRKLRGGSLNYYASVKSVVTQKWLKRNASQMNTLYDQDFDLIEGKK